MSCYVGFECFLVGRESEQVIGEVVVAFVHAESIGVFQEVKSVLIESEELGEAYNLAGEDGAGRDHLFGYHQFVVFK